jgi:hypothetical protein
MAINLLTSLYKLTKNQFSASVGAILVQLRAKIKGKTKKTNAKIFWPTWAIPCGKRAKVLC